MSGAQRTRSSTRIQLSPKQANIYTWGWQRDARFRYAVCGRRFGKTYLGAEEMRRAYRLAVEHNIHPDNEIWYGAPRSSRPSGSCGTAAQHSGRLDPGPAEQHRMRHADEDRPRHARGWSLDPDALRGSGLWFFLGDEWDDAKPVILPEIIRPMMASLRGRAAVRLRKFPRRRERGKHYNAFFKPFFKQAA